MKHITRATAAAGAALAAAGLLLAGPAQAVSGATPSGDWLFLTVTRGESPSTDSHGTLLLCDPPKGHPHAADACAVLAAAGGDIARIPQKDVFCPMIYAPVTARAHGQWKGRPVEFQETYAGECVMNARTGPVFALDG
ncbi:SSI family serine proteinase inhibitor [Streptomyces sp. NPDC090057]|uniref:SSI family serine proteinase inhibitor n=1 Tax=Streptomyces sp. NPDC090057 TaxID=3365935 RepID=UPI0037F1DD55